MTDRFACVQLDVPGHLGLDDGRYLVRGADHEQADAVVVVQTLGGVAAAAAGRAAAGRARAEPGEDSPEVPLTRLTVIPAEPSEPEAAARELQRTAGDPEAAEALVTAGLRAVNTDAARPPGRHPRSLRSRDRARGRSRRPDRIRHRRRARRGALGGGRGGPPARAPPAPRPGAAPAGAPRGGARRSRADRRLRDAASDERAPTSTRAAPGRRRFSSGPASKRCSPSSRGDAGSEQAEDLAALQERLESTAGAADEALAGELSAERTDEVAETLGICERVLRRRQILRPDSSA